MSTDWQRQLLLSCQSVFEGWRQRKRREKRWAAKVWLAHGDKSESVAWKTPLKILFSHFFSGLVVKGKGSPFVTESRSSCEKKNSIFMFKCKFPRIISSTISFICRCKPNSWIEKWVFLTFCFLSLPGKLLSVLPLITSNWNHYFNYQYTWSGSR